MENQPETAEASRPMSKEEAQELLRSAVSNNDIETIKKALHAGADINKDNAEVSGTPLHLAAEKGRLEASEALLELGATIDIHSDAWATSPLGAAAWCDQCELVRFLIGKGANVNKADPDGHTSMHFAAANGCAECVQLLYDSGAEAKITAAHGWTPLHDAASIGSIPVIELLLKWGLELNAEDSFGQTPLGYALRYNRHPVVELLRAKGGYCKSDKKNEEAKKSS